MNSLLTKSAILIVSALIVIYSLYSFSYNRGYQAKSIEVIEMQEKHIASLEKLSNQVVEATISTNLHNKKIYDDILEVAKTKPMYSIDKNGKCVPSKDFSETYKALLK